ncbi:MAG: deoxyribodipyrimidine photo-lyase [Phycisphaerae bacterium]
MRPLVWFRSDLRASDNAALSTACRAADRGVVGVFVVCPRQWQAHDWANVRVEFLLRNLASLSKRLEKLHIALRIIERPTFAQVPSGLLAVARQHRCDALYFNREYEVNESRRDADVTGAFEQAGLRVHPFDDTAVIPPDALRTADGRFYSVFTPFKRKWLASLEEGDYGALRAAPRVQPELVCPPDPVPEHVTGFDLDLGLRDRWPAGEESAFRQLRRFVNERIRKYDSDRDHPACDGTSRLSPYLAQGVLSPRRCLAEAAEANAGQVERGQRGVEMWISELIWREFYRHVLVGFPRVSMNRAFKVATERLPWRRNDEQFQAWCEGRTGFPIVDAGMRQLAQTGWMHNRLRMIVAMFLSKDLFIDWRWGERHFMRHLVDGDLASNNGGWQWSASTGTDAVPYFRIFNPWSQSRRVDPDGDFIRRWLPELGGLNRQVLHDPALLAREKRAGLSYPRPICNHAEARRHVLAVFADLPVVDSHAASVGVDPPAPRHTGRRRRHERF